MVDIPVRRLTLTRGQVCAKFGISEPTFEKRRATLEAAGFPPKLPGLNAWSEPAVDRWFHNWGRSDAAEIDPVRIEIVDEVRRALEDEYAGEAA